MEQANTTVIGTQVDSVGPLARASFLDETVTGGRTSNQLWTVRRVVPCLDDCTQMQLLGDNPIGDGGVLVTHGLCVERSDPGGRGITGDVRASKTGSQSIGAAPNYLP